MKSSFVTTRLSKWSYPVTINSDGDKTFAIFGDSFGASANDSIFDQWWPTKLAKKLGVKTYTNYCRGATSFYFTYNNFLQHYAKNDINVVLITQPNRYSKLTKLPSLSRPENNITNIGSLHEIRKNNMNILTTEDHKTLDYLEGWFIATDDQYMYDMQMLMVEHIIKLDPNAILIPCFYGSITPEMYSQLGLSENKNLYEVLKMQYQSFGSSKNINIVSDYIEKPESICCHFTHEFNDQVTDVVFERITTGKWNWNFTENIKHEHTLEHYYEQRTI